MKTTTISFNFGKGRRLDLTLAASRNGIAVSSTKTNIAPDSIRQSTKTYGFFR